MIMMFILFVEIKTRFERTFWVHTNRVMAIVLTLGREMMQKICAYEPQREDETKKSSFL